MKNIDIPIDPETRPAHTLEVAGEAYLFTRLPDLEEGLALEAHLEAQTGQDPQGGPALLYWDAKIDDQDGWVRFGRDGLDPILASEYDLSHTVAINRNALERLIARGGVKRGEGLSRATALLARSPGVRVRWIPGLFGRLDLAASPPLNYAKGPGAVSDGVTLAITLTDRTTSLDPFFAALRGQVLTREVEVVVLMGGDTDSSTVRSVTKSIEIAAAADPRLRIRRHILGGLTPSYLANMAVGLANTDAVVIADARCLPVSPNLVQRLADWSLSGDAVASSCRIMHDRRLLAAGLAFAAGDENDQLTVWNQLSLSDILRTAAAPAPWMFGVRRSAWIAAGGLRNPSRSDLWTWDFASAHGPRGRTILVGTELAEWIGVEGPAAGDTVAHRNVQPAASTALRDPMRSEDPIPDVSLTTRPTTAAPLAPRPDPSGLVVFSDSFPSRAATRALIFADRFGASQEIAFVQGLSSARLESRAAVRILEEKAFPGDSRTLDQADCSRLVEAQFDETEPTVVVLSRLGHSGVWRAVETAARRRGVPIVLHLDDDLLELPATLGVERYRLARNPMRDRTLREILTAADLVVAATPALKRRLGTRVGHDRFFSLEFGTAGTPARRRKRSGGDLVVGYMGSASHDHDLTMAAPALNRIAQRYSGVEIVLFGSIAEQPTALALTGRVTRHRPVSGDYRAFKARLAELDFDIGVAPLRSHPFNLCKTPTKWVEYAETGAATVVSRVEPYELMVAQGAALGVEGEDWEGPLRRLIEFPHLRRTLTDRADALLAQRFAWRELERQVLAALSLADPAEQRPS